MIELSKPVIGKEERENVLEVLDSGLLARGRFITDFEEGFAKYAGTKYAVTTANGTTALQVALKVVGAGPGDIFITTPFSFIATSNAIIYCGAKIEFADIEPRTFNISPSKIEAILKGSKKNIKGLVITHLYGLPCDMASIMKIVKKYKLILVEDCAQAHGAEFKGKRVGSFGDIAIFSFYGSKNMTTGEGGIITTNSLNLVNASKMLIDQGRTSKFVHGSIGFNYRMSNLVAAIGVAQLKKIDMFNNARIKNAAYLSERLKRLGWLKVPYTPPGIKHVFHQYAVRIAQGRDKLMEFLKTKGIASAPNYPIPIHKQPAYKKLGYGNRILPEAEKAAREILNLPVHPALKKEDLERIAEAIISWKK